MIDYQAIKSAPLAFLDYFSQWGGRPWERLIEIGLRHYLGEDLSGLKILEIGPGMGRMSCLLALLGGQVTGLDVKDSESEIAHKNTEDLGVSSQVEFIYYDGNLKVLEGKSYDIIFSKSALIYPNDLPEYLAGLNDLLKPNGKFVFIENAYGNIILHMIRWMKRRSRSFFKRTHYFKESEVRLIKSIFNVELVMRSKLPPIYLFCGRKK